MSENDALADLEDFIVRAKAATYASGGGQVLPYRAGSLDLQYREEGLVYHDSYFGGTDFLGQETVYRDGRPVWGMNYYGYLLSGSIDASLAGEVITSALTALYAEGRFLGGFRHTVGELTYVDETPVMRGVSSGRNTSPIPAGTGSTSCAITAAGFSTDARGWSWPVLALRRSGIPPRVVRPGRHSGCVVVAGFGGDGEAVPR